MCSARRSITQLIDYEEFCGIGPDTEFEAEGLEEITVQDLKTVLDNGEDVTLVDVREPHEWEICRIEGATLLPLSEIDSRLHELDSSQTLLVYCKTGVRSAKVIQRLSEVGFTRLKNVRGGIKAWAEEVDPRMPIY